jgi:alkylation response protein AidB-like acyl-CoA dehydrogenase
MRPDPKPAVAVAAASRALSAALAEHAAARDADGAFPREAFAELAHRGLLQAPPLAAARMDDLLRLLAEIGRGDLSTGRIYEGHVNARLLVELYGSAAQRRRLARPDHLLGVWNTDVPGDPLRLEDGRFHGKKSFASGIDGLTHAIVTVAAPPVDAGGKTARQMLLVPVAPLAVDRSWWRPMGMRSSGSHVAEFTGLAVAPGWALGRPDDYLAQPWFSAGAIRFLAVQVGGMHALLDTTTAHLARTGRAANPYQSQRLARIGAAVETGYLWLDRVAAAWSAAAREPASADRRSYLLAAAHGARGVIETSALTVLGEAEQAIGAAGMIAPHPFERQMRDLRVYLRQPNPDGAAAAFGAAVAAGDWTPGKDAGGSP